MKKTSSANKRAAAKPSGLSGRTVGLIAGGAVLASAGLAALLKTQTDMLDAPKKSPGRAVLEVLTSAPVLLGLGGAAGIGLFRWQMARLFSEEALYDVESLAGPDEVEIRAYSPQTVAETTVRAENFRQALDIGFETLASYIFGHNATGEKIEMTAPVTQTRERMATDVTMNEDGTWVVRFVMPDGHTLASLPSPLNHEVRLRALPARRVAALRYPGTFNGDDSEQMQLRLLANLKMQGLRPAGQTGFAGYDAPWTLPFLRRNEAWVELAP